MKTGRGDFFGLAMGPILLWDIGNNALLRFVQMFCGLPVVDRQNLSIINNLVAIDVNRFQRTVTGCVNQAPNGIIGRADHGVGDIHQGEICLTPHGQAPDIVTPQRDGAADGGGIE